MQGCREGSSGSSSGGGGGGRGIDGLSREESRKAAHCGSGLVAELDVGHRSAGWRDHRHGGGRRRRRRREVGRQAARWRVASLERLALDEMVVRGRLMVLVVSHGDGRQADLARRRQRRRRRRRELGSGQASKSRGSGIGRICRHREMIGGSRRRKRGRGSNHATVVQHRAMAARGH